MSAESGPVVGNRLNEIGLKPLKPQSEKVTIKFWLEENGHKKLLGSVTAPKDADLVRIYQKDGQVKPNGVRTEIVPFP